MDKQQAQNLIRETFEAAFDKERFTRFVKNLLNQIEDASFTYQGNYIPDAYKPYILSLQRIGKYSDGEHQIDILFVHLKKETSLERARTMQRNFIAWYLNGSRGGEMKDAALVAFVSPSEADWRFSLVKMDYRFEETKTGKIKVKEEFTHARRWSFLVGSNEASHTAQSRLEPVLTDDEHNPSLDQLEEAFNIETVTKEFFKEYRDLFIRTKEALDKILKSDPKVKTDFNTKGVDTVNFSKKLLGQIIFLYFLQKKGWFGVERDAEWGTGSKHFLRELFKAKHGDYTNFFNDILEPLFYEALRRPRDDEYYSRFNCKIPFLNGGLFDPIQDYDWVHTDINIPNELFSNTVITKEGDKGTGILDVFDRYNFTVKEDEPLEKEVAIDPELLGKAYEKFNAIRPDNFEEYKFALKSGKKGDESKFNKQFGVYYTPREIVHYMCQQSLINYLYTEMNTDVVSYEKIGDSQTDTFGNEAKVGQSDLTIEHSSESQVAKEDIEKLIRFGDQVGENEAAFVEKEQRIAEGKQKSTTLDSKLPQSIRQNAERIDRALADITVCDPAVGSGAFPVGMMHEIVKTRNVLSVFMNPPDSPLDRGENRGGGRTTYQFKRECIEKSLYGVEIDPGAVEIAKLRLWLSLVVDEEDIKNIKPLPNLDYKIVCGNSLVGVEKDLFNNELFTELECLKPLHLNETNPTKKQEYKKQIDDLISRITNGHTEFDFEVYFSEVFHKKRGFDVVIGNPPYV
ncbi:MAG: class I SAM-dependent DNA methyltransferase, partial [bacterium]